MGLHRARATGLLELWSTLVRDRNTMIGLELCIPSSILILVLLFVELGLHFTV